MKSTTHFKYLEFSDTKGLHEDTVQTLSDLKFLKDELRFLKNLIASHTLALINGKSPEETKTLYTLLMKQSKRLEKLIQEVEAHGNNLHILFDDIDVPGELKL